MTGILARQRGALDRLNVNAERGDQPARRAPRRRRRGDRRGPRRGRGRRRRAAPTSRPTSTRSTTSSPSCARRSSSSARPPAPGRRCSPACAPRRPGSTSSPAACPASTSRERARGRRARRGRGPGPPARSRHGRDEIADLRQGRDATRRPPSEILGDFVADLDDPRRAVEERRAGRAQLRRPDASRAGAPAARRPTGYTGIEALLNYVYYQSGAINQFDSFGHFLQFNVFDVGGGAVRRLQRRARRARRAAAAGRPRSPRPTGCVSWIGAEPARHQLRPRPAPLRQLGLPGRLDRPRALRPGHLDRTTPAAICPSGAPTAAPPATAPPAGEPAAGDGDAGPPAGGCRGDPARPTRRSPGDCRRAASTT